MYRSYSRVNLVRSPSFSKSGPRQPSTYLPFPLGRSSSAVLHHTRNPPSDPVHTRQTFSSSAYYADRFPHVRYSHSYESDNRAVGLTSSLPGYSRSHYSSYGGPYTGYTSIASYPTIRSRTEPALSYSNRYSSGYGGRTFGHSSYLTPSYDRPRAPTRDYIGHMNVDHAVDLYKNKYLTSGTLSKYFLSGRPHERSDSSRFRSSYSSGPSYSSSYSYSSYRSPSSIRSSYSRYSRY